MSVLEYAENILSLFQVIPGTILAIIFLIIFGVGDKVPIAMIIMLIALIFYIIINLIFVEIFHRYID